jgi:ATP-dependent DNA helicase PIF1
MLTTIQSNALHAIMSGLNVFITGVAGSGKSLIIKTYINNMKNSNPSKRIAVTSTTGMSAVLIGGQTLHSYTGIGIGDNTIEKIITQIKRRGKITIWKTLEVLIIDEVSMLSCELFEKLNVIAKTIRGCPKPFGGIQLICIGDFLQLPCINNKFCFESNIWNIMFPYTFYLTENHRINNKDFNACLEKVRMGVADSSVKKILNKKIVSVIEYDDIMPTILYTHNIDIDRENDKFLSELGCRTNKYKMSYSCTRVVKPGTISKECKDADLLVKDDDIFRFSSAPDILDLCIGAQVMFIINKPELGLVNGSRGVVTGFNGDLLPYVKFVDGNTHLIDLYTWNYLDENNTIEYHNTQLPLRLAWAISVHKSQGASIDSVLLSVSNSFDYGQVYVALSRVRDYDKLYIQDIDYNRIRAHPKSVTYYRALLERKQHINDVFRLCFPYSTLEW